MKRWFKFSLQFVVAFLFMTGFFLSCKQNKKPVETVRENQFTDSIDTTDFGMQLALLQAKKRRSSNMRI